MNVATFSPLGKVATELVPGLTPKFTSPGVLIITIPLPPLADGLADGLETTAEPPPPPPPVLSSPSTACRL